MSRTMRVAGDINPNSPSNNAASTMANPTVTVGDSSVHRFASPSRLSPEVTMDDRLSPERDNILSLPLPRLPSSRHVSPARETSPHLPSPDPSEPSYTPAPTALSATPPPTIPPSSFGSTNRAPSTAGTENSFEVLSGYDPVAPAERHRQWHRDQRREIYHPTPTSAFHPNSDLPYAITPQLLGYYGPRGAPPPQMQRGEEYMLTRRYEPEQAPSPSPYRGQAGGGTGGGSTLYDSRFSPRGGGQIVGASSGGHYRSSSSEISAGGSSCSGIPSFTREFDPRVWRSGKGIFLCILFFSDF